MINQQARIPHSSIPETKASFDFENGEILNINKPEGWSSFDVVKKIRYHIKVKKVGHAGTLDPFASGVLLICTGRATKKVQELMNFEKEYQAQIELGTTTDTYDRTGKILKQNPTRHLTAADLEKVCDGFRGEIYQIPPMYSAIKIKGKRLYDLARRGEIIEREPRKITIYKIDLLDFQNPFVTLKIVCSKGTYIRALAHDIGENLGCGAYLKSLIRTRIGPYKIESAYLLSNFIQTI
ncbi:MAG: tRNA pseudouridine(55) synthase TruB [bacterium]